jgi:hypothetical protein
MSATRKIDVTTTSGRNWPTRGRVLLAGEESHQE